MNEIKNGEELYKWVQHKAEKGFFKPFLIDIEYRPGLNSEKKPVDIKLFCSKFLQPAIFVSDNMVFYNENGDSVVISPRTKTFFGKISMKTFITESEVDKLTLGYIDMRCADDIQFSNPLELVKHNLFGASSSNPLVPDNYTLESSFQMFLSLIPVNLPISAKSGITWTILPQGTKNKLRLYMLKEKSSLSFWERLQFLFTNNQAKFFPK